MRCKNLYAGSRQHSVVILNLDNAVREFCMQDLANTAWSFAITIMRCVNSMCRTRQHSMVICNHDNAVREFYMQELAHTA